MMVASRSRPRCSEADRRDDDADGAYDRHCIGLQAPGTPAAEPGTT
jgi:hypothetical protein